MTLGRPAFGFDDHRFRRWVGRLLVVVAVAQVLGFVARGAVKPSDPVVTPLPASPTTVAPTATTVVTVAPRR